MQKINEKVEYGWLQISDLHIFDNTEWKVMEDAYNNLEYKKYVKFILVTGDLHNFKEDYEKAKIFLEKLLVFFNLTKKIFLLFQEITTLVDVMEKVLLLITLKTK